MTWRDENGLTLADFPRPSLAVDVALLTLHVDEERDRSLCVVLHRREGSFAEGAWALPGSFVHEGERLAKAVRRAVRGKTGLDVRSPRQLAVFDDPRRDDRGHVVSVAHADLLPERDLAASERWALGVVDGSRVRAPGGQRRLPFDHDAIVAHAVSWARERYGRRPDPARLLDKEEFSLRELRLVHEAVLGRTLLKDAFRRKMEHQLEPTGGLSSGVRGPRAALFRLPPA